MKLQDVQARVSQWRRQVGRGAAFLKRDVWDLDLAALPWIRSLGVRFLRVVILVFRGFKDDECSMHASALTFSTLMAIVPILALCLSMARGLGDADTAKLWVQARVQDWTQTFKTETEAPPVRADESAAGTAVLPGETAAVDPETDQFVQNELAMRINLLVEKGFEKVDNINFAKLGTVGLVLLIWMVIEVLGRVERSFNRVWGITVGRTVWRRFTDYLSVLLILPILIVAAASMPVMDMVTRFMPSDTAVRVQQVVASGFFKNGVVVVMTTLVFAFVIMFMPNTSMKVKSGLTGGLVSAVLFLLWLWICAMVQVGAAKYGRIYGSFAVAPIVLAWVHVSWQIVLFGAEVAFSVENCDTFRMEQSAADANVRARLTLALSVVVEAARRMETGKPPFDLAEYGHQRRIPVRLLNAVTDELVRGGYMVPVTERPGVYVLLRAPASLPVQDIVNVVMNAGSGVKELGLVRVDTEVLAAVKQAFDGMSGTLADLTVDRLLAQGTVHHAGKG
jgi:membrane protein